MEVVLVDNETNALNFLNKIISGFPDINVKKTFNNSIEALVYLLKNKCDMVFLDIEMPGVSGVYLAEQIITVYPETKICFVTAYNDFAVKAFELNALDYVLKPYTADRIESTIKKMNSYKNSNEAISKLSEECSYELDIIGGLDDEDVVLLKPEDIFYIETANRIVLIHVKDKIYKGNKTLNFYEEKLKKHSFFRTHKCYIVNLEKVDKFKPRINYTYDIYFKGSEDIVPLSRSKVKELKNLLEVYTNI